MIDKFFKLVDVGDPDVLKYVPLPNLVIKCGVNPCNVVGIELDSEVLIQYADGENAIVDYVSFFSDMVVYELKEIKCC